MPTQRAKLNMLISYKRLVIRYTIKQEIGRGSFGAVHLVEDQTGKRYVRPLAFISADIYAPGCIHSAC